MRISHFTALLLACVLLFLPTVGLAAPSSLSVAVVADDHLALRPLELNQRDVVSLLGLVYEGLCVQFFQRRAQIAGHAPAGHHLSQRRGADQCGRNRDA